MRSLKILGVIALMAIAGAANAVTVTQQYNGQVVTCPPFPALCGIFGAAGGALDVSFDLSFTGAGTITSAGAISNVSITILKTDGNFLSFVNGTSVAANFDVDASGNILSGQMTLRATGATSGATMDAVINVGPSAIAPVAPDSPLTQIAAGEWEANLPDVATNTPGAFVAAGTGSFASVVPVPAAAWLFGSALGLMGWIRRRVAA